MAKHKLAQFQENLSFAHLIQPSFDEVFGCDYHLKSHWAEKVFKNTNPIVLELGCGKGEYAIGLSEKFPQKNYIGVDIKGARLWRGAKTVQEMNMPNVVFLRSRIEFIKSVFANDEISEIWVTFPDPQPKRFKKRLTSSKFLNYYRNFLCDGGLVHLKTDNDMLYEYTHELVKYNNLKIRTSTPNLYAVGSEDEILSIRTFYESQYLAKGKTINYISFHLEKEKEIREFRP